MAVDTFCKAGHSVVSMFYIFTFKAYLLLKYFTWMEFLFYHLWNILSIFTTDLFIYSLNYLLRMLSVTFLGLNVKFVCMNFGVKISLKWPYQFTVYFRGSEEKGWYVILTVKSSSFVCALQNVTLRDLNRKWHGLKKWLPVMTVPKWISVAIVRLIIKLLNRHFGQDWNLLFTRYHWT